MNSQYYDEVYKTTQKYQVSYELSSYYPLWQLLTAYIPRDKNIVDLGCGPGQVAELLYDLGYRNYLGLDFSEVAIDRAQNKFRDNKDFNFRHADITKSPIPFGQVYLAIEFLEHLKDDYTVIEQLPEGSILIASVPDFMCEGHYRCFENKKDIIRKYGAFIGFNALVKFDNYYIFTGVVKDNG